MNDYEVFKLAGQTGQTVVHPNPASLPRVSKSTQYRSAQRTGDTIYGHFEYFRNKDGVRVFIGENGQYLKRR